MFYFNLLPCIFRKTLYNSDIHEVLYLNCEFMVLGTAVQDISRDWCCHLVLISMNIFFHTPTYVWEKRNAKSLPKYIWYLRLLGQGFRREGEANLATKWECIELIINLYVQSGSKEINWYNNNNIVIMFKLTWC